MINPNTQEYIRSLGLDPTSVLREGWNDTHYHAFVKDMAGRRVVEREWPEGFQTVKLIEAMKKDGVL